MELDYFRYLLLFPNTELIVYSNGDFCIGKWDACRYLDKGTCKCTVHYTPEQPRTCSYYNAHRCWYKKNFVTDSPPDLYRLNLARFDVWVREFVLDSNGTIVSVPSYAHAVKVIQDIPLDVRLTLLPEESRLPAL